MRDQENFAKPPQLAQTGWFVQCTNELVVGRTTPSAPYKVAARISLDVAATLLEIRPHRNRGSEDPIKALIKEDSFTTPTISVSAVIQMHRDGLSGRKSSRVR